MQLSPAWRTSPRASTAAAHGSINHGGRIDEADAWFLATLGARSNGEDGGDNDDDDEDNDDIALSGGSGFMVEDDEESPDSISVLF